jgi:catechol-2,3-dioxygenase
MLKLSHIDHLNLQVLNLKESASFYKRIFGFEIKEEGLGSSGEPYMIIGKSKHLMLCMYEVKGPIPSAGIDHFGFNIENYEEMEKFLKAEEVPIHYGGEVSYPESESFYIEDPNGYGIELSRVFGGGL